MPDVDTVPTSSDQVAPANHEPAWRGRAPIVSDRVSWWLFIPIVILVLASPWAAIQRIPMGAWITFVSPIALFVMGMTLYGRTSNKMSRRYASLLTKKLGLDEHDEDLKNSIVNHYKKESSISNTVGISFVALFFYLEISYIYIVARDIGLILGSDTVLLKWLFGILIGFVCLLPAMIYSISVMGASRYYKFELDHNENIAPKIIDLAREDRNDIDIAGLAIALQTLMRRADSYTVESTLLSALAFSAFVGIAFSDQGPIESSTWIWDSFATLRCSQQDL